jgi:hypothetical protein
MLIVINIVRIGVAKIFHNVYILIKKSEMFCFELLGCIHLIKQV